MIRTQDHNAFNTSERFGVQDFVSQGSDLGNEISGLAHDRLNNSISFDGSTARLLLTDQTKKTTPGQK